MDYMLSSCLLDNKPAKVLVDNTTDKKQNTSDTRYLDLHPILHSNNEPVYRDNFE